MQQAFVIILCICDVDITMHWLLYCTLVVTNVFTIVSLKNIVVTIVLLKKFILLLYKASTKQGSVVYGSGYCLLYNQLLSFKVTSLFASC